MLLLVVVLVGTNLVSLGVLLWFRLRPADHPSPDPVVAASLDAMRPPASTSSTRRIITIEILNPIELAGTRGRLVGVAGSLAPRITRRIVYDQAVRNLRQQLVREKVVADVRLHTVSARGAGEARRAQAPLVDVVEVETPPEAASPE